MLSFEGEQFLGQQPIYNKLTSFNKITHKIGSIDSQPSVNEGILAIVSGTLQIDDGQDMMFTEVFHLQKGGQQGYYIFNDIFRLNLA